MKNSEEVSDPNQKPMRWGEKYLFYLGAAALLFAMGVDTIAVLGRHLGLPLWGSIEMVQAAILVASSSAILSATLARKHVRVRILMDRLKGRSGIWLQRIQDVFSALFFCLLTAGSVWIFLDLRNGYEESEILHIPYAPLRIICMISILAVMVSFLRRIKNNKENRDHE
jgi:TRAP-type C4-dicarboxylate transport system permease small subunit